MKDELIAGITALGGSSLAGSITIATIPIATTATVPAAGLAGLLGLTTTATGASHFCKYIRRGEAFR